MFQHYMWQLCLLSSSILLNTKCYQQILLFLLIQKQCPRGIQEGMGGRDIKTLEKLPKTEKIECKILVSTYVEIHQIIYNKYVQLLYINCMSFFSTVSQ